MKRTTIFADEMLLNEIRDLSLQEDTSALVKRYVKNLNLHNFPSS